MNPIAHLVGRAPVVPAVDPESQTCEMGGVTVQLTPCQFRTFLALRPLTPVTAGELADLLHFKRDRFARQNARYRIFALRHRLREATGRDDFIESTAFGYRLTRAS